MRLQVAKIAANGSIRQWVVDTAGRSDAGRWEELIARVPAVPPPYRAAPGSAVYDIRVDDGKFLVGEHDLSGPLSDLVRAVLVEGDAVLAAQPKPGTRGHGAATDPALGTWRYQVRVLAISPPYRAAPGRPVHVLHASDRAVLMGEDNLIGSLRHPVTTILAAGDPS